MQIEWKLDIKLYMDHDTIPLEVINPQHNAQSIFVILKVMLDQQNYHLAVMINLSILSNLMQSKF